MRIAIDIRSLLDQQPGGIKTYTTEIIRALSQIAPQHDYVLFYNAAQAVTLPDLPVAMEVVALRYPNKIFNSGQWAFAWPRWDSFMRADCYFAPALRLMPLSLQIPLVATVHDLSFVFFPEFYSWRRRIWHRLMRPQRFMRRATHLIAVSEATARDVHTVYGIPQQRISVIHSGVKNVTPPPTENEFNEVRHRYRLPPSYILFLSTLEPRKNVPSVIRAFEAIADQIPQSLVLAGERGWLTREIQRAVRSTPARARIHFPGVIAEADKVAVMAGADLFVYPSFYEGFGFPPLEALLQGTPVVASHNSALPEVVGEWVTLINPYDVGELAVVMRELLRQPGRVDHVVIAEIQQRYSWERAARQTLAVITQAHARRD